MSLLPLMDPRQSLRESAKHLLLLEDHLAHPSKRCSDCINKHLLTAEAFAEEAAALNAEGEWASFAGEIAEQVRGLAGDAQDKSKRAELAQRTRLIRKDLVGRLGVAVPEKEKVGPTVEGSPSAGSPAHSIQIAVARARYKLVGKHEIWGVFSKGDVIVAKVAPGGHSVPSTWMGFPVRTVRTSKPRLSEAVQAARTALASKVGVGAVSRGKGCIQVVSVKTNLPAKLFGWPVCVRPPGSLSLLMGLFGAQAPVPRAGDHAIYAWTATGGGLGWWPGTVARIGVNARVNAGSDETEAVSAIPAEDGALGVIDTDDSAWWAKANRWVVVKKPLLSVVLASSYDESKGYMIDLIQGMVQSELPDLGQNAQRRLTFALVVAADRLSKLNPDRKSGDGLGLFSLDDNGAPVRSALESAKSGSQDAAFIIEQVSSSKVVKRTAASASSATSMKSPKVYTDAGRYNAIIATRLVISDLVSAGVERLGDVPASRYLNFVATCFAPWDETEGVMSFSWMERGRELVISPGVAGWLGQPVPAGASPTPAARIAPTAPVSPPTQPQSPPTNPAVSSPPLSAPLVVQQTAPAPSTFTSLNEWALSEQAGDAFLTRWSTNANVMRAMMKAKVHENHLIAARSSGNARRMEREAKDAATTWHDVGNLTRDAWPYTRSAVIYFEIGDAGKVKRSLERALEDPHTPSDIHAMIRQELNTIGEPRSGSALAKLWAKPEGKALAAGVGVSVALLALSVFGGD